MAERTRRQNLNPVPKSVKVDDDLWERFGLAASKHDLDRSAALRQFMRWYVHDTELEPQRPSTATPPVE